MKFSSAAVLFTSALGASAHPNRHGHNHVHRSLESRDFVKYIMPNVEHDAPPPASNSQDKPKPETSDEVKDNSSGFFEIPECFEQTTKLKDAGLGITSYAPFCNGYNTKRATMAEIMYKGNVGTPDDYGCNIMLIHPTLVERYKYVVRLENVDKEEYECVAYLKIGADGGVNGFFYQNAAHYFKLEGRTSQYIAIDENTQGGFICAKGSIPLTHYGACAASWAEIDICNHSNDDWSGGDASCLVATGEGLHVPGLQVAGHGTISLINEGGTGENAFLAGMEEEDGIGLNIPPGDVCMTVTFGGFKLK